MSVNLKAGDIYEHVDMPAIAYEYKPVEEKTSGFIAVDPPFLATVIFPTDGEGNIRFEDEDIIEDIESGELKLRQPV